MSAFKVDVLLKALEELQKGVLAKNHCGKKFLSVCFAEKRLNEQVLSQEYSKRKKLESELDKTLSLLTRTSEEDARSREALKMEEQRVQDTQRQILQ